MAVQRCLKAPVYAYQLYLLADGRVKEVQIEDRTDDIALDSGQLYSILVYDILAQESIGLLAVLLIGGGGEESPLQSFDGMRKLDHDQLFDVLRLHRLGKRQACLLQYPVIIPLVPPLLGAQQISRAEQRHRELILNRIYSAIGGEGAVGNEKSILILEHILVFRLYYL